MMFEAIHFVHWRGRHNMSKRRTYTEIMLIAISYSLSFIHFSLYYYLYIIKDMYKKLSLIECRSDW